MRRLKNNQLHIQREKKKIPKKVWIPVLCAVLVLLLAGAGVLIWVLTRPDEPSDDPTSSRKEGVAMFADAVIRDPETDRGRFTGYTHVVVASDTPDETLAELEQYGIKPIEYEEDDSLFAPGNPWYLAEMGKNSKIYLCEGTYELENGPFMTLDAETPVTVSGEGKDKTLIVGSSRTRDSKSAAFHLIANEETPVENAVIENLSISGFEYGVRIENGNGIALRNLNVERNHFVGVSLENASNCEITGCDLVENGRPDGADTGYGLSLLYDSTGNTGSGNLYKNNANKNAVDFLERGTLDTPPNNNIVMEMVYDLERDEKPIQDPDNIQPTEEAIRVEMETGEIDGTGAVVINQAEKVDAFTGDGYVFLFNTTIRLTVNVPEAGSYRLFIVGTSDDGNNKCDYVQVNGGERYLTSYLGKNQGQWTYSQPGTEVWENDELHPDAPDDGFALNAGENEILITANWGYCCYDAVVLEPIE